MTPVTSTKSESLLKILLKLKLNFPNIHIAQTGGTGTNFDFEVRPIDFLKYAKKDFKNGDGRGLINAITNAKRAIDCQTDTILSIFNIKFDETLPKAAIQFIQLTNNTENTNEKHNLKLIEALGLAPIGLISKVRRLRHSLEHYYEYPSLNETKDAIELAELYINATQNKIKMMYEINISNEEYDFNFATPSTGMDLMFKDGDYFMNLSFGNKKIEDINFDNTEIEFYYFLKMILFYDDDEELSECLSGILCHLNHPQSKLKINVIVD